VRRELWRHPSLWLARADVLTLRCCGREPRDSLDDAMAWRRVVLMAGDDGRPTHNQDAGRPLDFSRDDLAAANVWEAVCRRTHGASSLLPWNPRPRPRPPLPDMTRFAEVSRLAPAKKAPSVAALVAHGGSPFLLADFCATRASLADLGDRRWRCHAAGDLGCRCTAAALGAYGAACTDDDPLVLFDHEAIPEQCVVPPPAAMGDDLLEEFAGKTEELWRDTESAAAQLLGRERRWLVAGGRGAGSQWHRDPFWTSAYHCLLSGRKLWCFFAPAQAGALPPGLVDEHAAPAADAWFREWEHLLRCDAELAIDGAMAWCVQKPGDCVLVPPGLWHCTLNLEASVAFTCNVVNGRDAKAVRASGLAIARDDAALGDAYARLVRARRSDDDEKPRAAPRHEAADALRAAKAARGGKGTSCEVRSVGGSWQRFASQSAAVGRFPGLTQPQICALVGESRDGKLRVRSETVRGTYEARDYDGDDLDGPAPMEE